ncbi:DJ-1/PfpI family protein [Rhizobium halophytocola]|uniref:Intracellular protease/amidase n=1 Tax=Rhizobium halophytocola TaxID=735519 RepID=A0ABS4E1X1_9HYPH|nr:DJ-1/PfpI family protein [Rhizobium halophytocola]MBP1851916.1 putative intracellular protease/amidase [Rhizobium halophytocola]
MTQTLDRRTLLTLAAMSTAGLASLPAQDAKAETMQDHMTSMGMVPKDAPRVAMLVYPNMVAMDLIGPMTVFKIMRFNIELVGKDKSPASTDVGIPMAATHTFDECPGGMDVLFVPGGTIGTIACMQDRAVMDFMADRGNSAKWVTSVCTGSLVLAAAGLLKGYDATAHWAVADLLPLMGARHVEGRVVRDRNRMTGGGVTAGIDFALTLAAEMKGEEAAKRAALTIEYAPQPPFQSGMPQEAGEAMVASMRSARHTMDDGARQAAIAAGKRLGLQL